MAPSVAQLPVETNGHSTNALCSVDEFVSQSYDYIVVGGGTAGLCVAARLSENPDVKVAVIEGGANRMDDPSVSTPALYPAMIGREKYDWCFTSVPQVCQVLQAPSLLHANHDNSLQLVASPTLCLEARCLVRIIPPP